MSNLIELKVPDIGGHSNVDVIEVFIQPGQTVAVDDSLITLETDKATMEVPAEAAGVVKEVRAVLGGKISEGDVIAIIEVGAAAGRCPGPGCCRGCPGCCCASSGSRTCTGPCCCPGCCGQRWPQRNPHSGYRRPQRCGRDRGIGKSG